MRCAIYTRVSTDEQAMSEYISLKRQEKICRNYADIHSEKGWKVAAVYEDAGYSGKDFQRPGIQELVEDVRAGKVDAIVTYKIDRINILLSFAQFERELTRERTMSKMAGRAEKGLRNGRYSPLGFDYGEVPFCQPLLPLPRLW